VETPGNDRPAIDLHGVPARILELCAVADSADIKLPGTMDPESQFSVVAGARNHLDLLLTITAISPHSRWFQGGNIRRN